MIVDNADDADVWEEPSDTPLIKYLPRGSHGSLLITTRNSQLGKTFLDSRKRPIEVPIFGPQDSAALLRSRTFEDNVFTNNDCKEVTRILDYLPPAITQAAAYLN